MHVNKGFGKLVENGAIEYAPKAVKIEGYIRLHPTAEEYAVLGYVPVVDERPTEPVTEGYHYEERGWEERDGTIRRIYEMVANPPAPPRVFSKLKCVAALMQAGVWAEVKAWIEASGLYDLYLAAQDFREDNEYFVQGKTQLMEVLEWTDEQVESILKESEA